MLAAVALVVLATLAFIPHVRHGGFTMDDWSNAAGALEPPGGPGFGNALSYFADLTIYRPVLVLYVPVTYLVLGMHMADHLILAAALAVFVAVMLYGILRTLRVPWFHAGFIAALTIVYPWYDSTRLWATGAQISLSVGLVLAGLWIALVGLSRRSWRWHAAAAALYLTSILTYEVTLPVVAAAGLLYILAAGWRVAKWRWAVDLSVALVGGAWVGTHTARTKAGLSAQLDHLGNIVNGAGTLLGRTLIPFGQARTGLALGLLVVFAVAGVGALALSHVRFGSNGSWGLREWLLLVAGGLLLAALGWVMFIPADPYYTPTVYGMTNRVNGLAGIGLIVAVYGAFGVVGTLVGGITPGTRRTALVVTLALGLLLGAANVDVLRRHIGIWNLAFTTEMEGVERIKDRFPDLAPETTLFASGYPAYQTLGVPILASTWDLDGIVKTEYGDGTLAAYPVVYGTRLVCAPEGVKLVGSGIDTWPAPYGTAYLFDLQSYRYSRPKTRGECRDVARKFLPGPGYLSFEY